MSDVEEHHEEFEAVGSGASSTYPMQCSALRKNGYVVIKGRPCKIVDMSTSKTGKHGHAKVHLVATDIFTGKKLEDLSPSTHNMEVPIVHRTEYPLVDIEDHDDGSARYMVLMNDDGSLKEDIVLPDNEEGRAIEQKFRDEKEVIVTVLSSMGEESCITHKEISNKD